MDLLSPATIKWLQSLGIGIKHPKWDCANGVVVASILSKYFPGEETLKNFYTGSSAAAKSNNWDQLRKFFVRNGINVKLDAIHAVMNSHDAAAVRTSFLLPLPLQSIELTSLTQCLFLENLFTLLTGRR
ncbi:spermatogenesis-associated protein 4 [Irineochytrium annulatum]|nr:spermatogenesis-associated protein 4 [Irineochytrium annulatum]